MLAFTPDSEVFGWNEGTVSAYRLDPQSGTLSYINKQPSLGSILAHNSLDRTGRFLFVANYSLYPEPEDSLPDQSVVVFPIRADGGLGPACVQPFPFGPRPQSPPGRRGRMPIASSPVPTTPMFSSPISGSTSSSSIVSMRRPAPSRRRPASFKMKAGGGTQALRLPSLRSPCLCDQRARFDDRGSCVRCGVGRTRASCRRFPRFRPDMAARAIAPASSLRPMGAISMGRTADMTASWSTPSTNRQARLSFVEHQSCLGRTPRDFAIDPIRALPARRQPGQRRSDRFPHRP